jgi:hypothetical protein
MLCCCGGVVVVWCKVRELIWASCVKYFDLNELTAKNNVNVEQ